MSGLDQLCKIIKLSDAVPKGKARKDCSRVFVPPVESTDLPASADVDLFESIPPRPFIFKRLYVAGFVTGTAATEGLGKTSVVDVEVISMALGRDLLDSGRLLRAGPQRVLVLQLEDDITEFRRRHRAIFEHYRLSREDFDRYRENLKAIFDSDGAMKLLRRIGNELRRDESAIGHLKGIIAAHQATVVTIDPLVSLHEAEENVTGEMQQLLAVLRSIARDHGACLHYLHHTRKGGTDTADAMRGAVSLRDGSRALRMLTRMSAEEAKQLNIEEKMVPFLIGEFNGKSNFDPGAGGMQWYRTISVGLDNETEQFAADSVGVVTSYRPPDLLDGISQEQCFTAWKQIKHLPQESMRYNPQASGWMGYAIAPALGLSTADKARISKILFTWERGGVIAREDIPDGKKGRLTPYYRFVEMPEKEKTW